MSEPKAIWNLECELGEGPVWVDGALWFVDIKKQKIYRTGADGSGRRSWDAPEQVGFILPAEDGSFVTGLQSGLYRFDPESGAFTLITEMEPERPHNRLNDGTVDPSGRLWFGTMDNKEKDKTGAFYRFQKGAVVRTGLEGIAITNGPCLSPDGRILYFVDTLGGTIEAADVAEDGTLGDARPFVHIDPKEGHPDGPTIDSEGCVWIGLYAGWEARRYSPQGELVGRVRFPVGNITKIAFGGDDLRTVYATTARQLLRPDQIEKQPQAGDLFEFRVDVPGISCPKVTLG
jgi:sugar lactone lactonase YvrE